jgi:hypothetical protein
MRTRRLLTWLPAALVLAPVVLAPSAALAVESTTIHFTATDSREEDNPCSGEPGTLTIVVSGVIHLTDLGNGDVHMTTATTGTVTFIPDDPDAPSFTGHLAEQLVQNENARNATVTNAENVVVHGSDGSLGKQHVVLHVTLNANGTVTSSIDIDEFSCLA